MRLKIEILHKGMLSSIQDIGRFGYKHLAIPQSGWMDKRSAQIANILVGNEIDSPNIEMTLQSVSMLFHDTASIAITGADMKFKIDKIPIELNKTYSVSAGSKLTGTYAKEGFRSYLAIGGTPVNYLKSYDSYSTYPYCHFGGLNGTYLEQGDILIFDRSISESLIDINTEISPLDTDRIFLIEGPEFNMLSDTDKQILLNTKFKISANSNRMGARLEDLVSRNESRTLDNSVPVTPGTIQCLPNGQLVVLLQDAQTTGGYPRVGIITPNELNKFNQIRPGKTFNLSFS